MKLVKDNTYVFNRIDFTGNTTDGDSVEPFISICLIA